MEPASSDTLGTASLACGALGIVVYCCGSFLCIGVLAFPLWVLGLVLGVVGAFTRPPGQNTMSVLGIVLNVLPAVGFGLLMMLGVGAGVISSILEQAQRR